MARFSHRFVFAIVLGAGCATAPKPEPPTSYAAPQLAQTVQRLPAPAPDVQLVAHTQSSEPEAARPVMRAVQVSAALSQVQPEELPPGIVNELSPGSVLDVDRLTAEVVDRNPSVQAMLAAWQAAAERYPQVVALDDLMLDVSVGPGSWGNSSVESA